jgi:Skp family chaperone for outer membrane proteins
MFYSQKSAAIFTSTILAFGLATQAFGQATHLGAVGTVDRDKVITSYPKAQQYADELKKAEDKVHKLIEDSNKQYEDAKNAHKSPSELEGLQRRLQTSIDDEVKRIQARAQSLESQLENDIQSAISAEANSRKVDMVLMKQLVLVGGTDITDGVVKRLNPAGTASTAATKTK